MEAPCAPSNAALLLVDACAGFADEREPADSGTAAFAALDAAAAAQRKVVEGAMLRLMNQDHSEFLLAEYERERETLARLTEQLARIFTQSR